MEQNVASTSRGKKRQRLSSPVLDEPKKPYEWSRMKNSKMYALIINVLCDREGAEHDNTTLKKLLRRCNFNIMMCTDFSEQGIKKSIADFKSELKKGNIDGCIVALMSHGTKDEWFSTSIPKQRLSLYDDIVDQLNRKNCPYLDDVPKIFLVNMCRGELHDSGCDDDPNYEDPGFSSQSDSISNDPAYFDNITDDVQTDDSSTIFGSSWKDMLICHATYLDCKAYRFKSSGTLYIQKFCEMANKHIDQRPTDIEKIIKHVNNEVPKIQVRHTFEENKITISGRYYQTPSFKNVGYLHNMLYLSKREMGGSKRVTSKFLEANVVLNSKKKIKWPITHGLLTNAGNFSGREEELGKLKKIFKSEEQLVLVYGFGGIGKTELCRKFANMCLTDDVSTSRIWLHGETVDTLNSSVKDVADYLGVSKDPADKDPSVYFSRIVQMILENSGRLLVVIDNVDEIYEEVKSVIKLIQNVQNKKMFVIVTSRNSAVLGSAKNSINLDVLSPIEARGMLQTSLPSLSDSDADELGELVQNFPLALQQAVAFIKQQQTHFRTPNYSVSNYVKEFEEKKKLMLGQQLDEFEHDYKNTTLIVWNMTLDKIKIECKDAGEILKIVAHLNPDLIQLDFLEEICKRRKLDFDRGFNIINKYCIVQLDANFNRKMCSIHRLLQDVLRGENNNFEYARALFDDAFFVSVARAADVRYRVVIDGLESFHLQSVCKYANLKWDNHSFIYFHAALFIVLELNRLDCALQCITLKYPQFIESNSTELSEEMKVEFIEKFILWFVINGPDDKVTKGIVMNGEYDAGLDNYYDLSVNSIEEASKIFIKYFGENSTQHFSAINKLVKRVCPEDIDKAIEICEGISNFQFDSEKKLIHFDTIFTIFEALDNKKAVEIPQVERVEKIVAHFSKVHPESVELVGLLEGIIFDFKDDYVKAQDLIKQFLPQLEENNSKLIKWWYEKKELELKIKTIDFDVLTREEIEREFGKVNYNKFSLRGLEKIEKNFEVNFGDIDPLTVRINVAVASKLWSFKGEKCIELCEFVLNSPVDTEYETAFKRLCYAKYIHNNYDDQKVILEKLLAQKESLGENHSNVFRVKQLLANTMEKLCKLTVALDLFEQVKKYAVDCGWSEKDLKESRTDVARLKLRIGDFSYIKTREDIYREFGEFDDYDELSFEQLQKMLQIYISVLGDSDKLTLKLKFRMALKLHFSKEHNKSLELLEDIIGSEENEDLIQKVYNLMYHIGCDLYKNDKNYDKAKEVLERVLQYQTQTGQDVTETNNALAEVEKLRN